MTQPFLLRVRLLCTIIFAATAVTVVGQIKPGRDPGQPIDEQYTGKIREYTTQPFFNSPLTDYLPASPNVPTPKSVLGDVAGAPGKLPYAAEVYRYMRMLERASPRVKVFSIVRRLRDPLPGTLRLAAGYGLPPARWERAFALQLGEAGRRAARPP